jgi:hypothetical protein
MALRHGWQRGTLAALPEKRMTQRPRLLAAALALFLGASAPAWATASLTCDGNDRNLSFEFLGNVGSGDGGSIQLIGGAIKLKAIRGKFDATEFNIGPAHIAGHWSFGKELRIGIAPDAVGDVSVFLVIIAEQAKSADGDMDRYRGSYVLKVRAPKGESKLKGKLKGCDVG